MLYFFFSPPLTFDEIKSILAFIVVHLFTVLQPLWDLILGKSALISNQRRVILWRGKTTLALKTRGTINQKSSPAFYSVTHPDFRGLLEHPWGFSLRSVLPSVLCLTVSRSQLKTLRNAFCFSHTFKKNNTLMFV